MKLYIDTVPSPIGAILVVTDDRSLCALDFEDHRERMMRLLEARFGEVVLVPKRNPLGISRKIDAYLGGRLEVLEEIPVDTGGTPFQRRVWKQLRKVPAGKTASYGDIARAVGRPKAVRAVGATNGRNPVVLVVPCHRVIGADGTLTGYGSGLDRKQWLLEHEKGVRHH